MGSLVAVGGADGAAAAPSRSGCSQTRERQFLQVKLSWRYTERLSRTYNGQLVERVIADQTRQFGTLSIGGATCKQRGGGWRVIDPIAVGYNSVGLDAVGNIQGSGLSRGWAIGIRSGAGGSAPRIALQVMHCGKGIFFSTLKEVVGVPVPKLNPLVGVGLWGAGKLLPADKVKCGDLGVKPLRAYANTSGVLRVADFAVDTPTETKHFPSPNGGMNYTKQFRVQRIHVVGP